MESLLCVYPHSRFFFMVELSFRIKMQFITVKAPTLDECIAKAGRRFGLKSPVLSEVRLHSERAGIGVYSATLGPSEPSLFDQTVFVTFQQPVKQTQTISL